MYRMGEDGFLKNELKSLIVEIHTLGGLGLELFERRECVPGQFFLIGRYMAALRINLCTIRIPGPDPVCFVQSMEIAHG